MKLCTPRRRPPSQVADPAHSARSDDRRRRGILLTWLVAASLALIIWTIYLGWQLPKVYISDDWRLAWVGLDVFEIALLVLTTWAAYQRRIVLIFFAAAAATMFVIDAWFDVTTARSGDFSQSLLAAFVVELPAAFVLSWVAIRAFHRVVRSWLRGTHQDPSTAIWSLEIPRRNE